MAAPALRHDVLRTEATIEDVRRGTATRQRSHRSAASGRPLSPRAGSATASAAMPLTAPRTSPRHAPSRAPRVIPREEETEELVDSEHHEAARRRVRRGHTARALPRVPLMAAAMLLGQVLLLLYVTSLGMASTHASDDLDKKIAATTEEIKQSQKRISAATSKHQMEVWAAKLHLRQVQQSDIDRVDESARPVDNDAPGEVQ